MRNWGGGDKLANFESISNSVLYLALPEEKLNKHQQIFCTAMKFGNCGSQVLGT
jgi:hypothetical protein